MKLLGRILIHLLKSPLAYSHIIATPSSQTITAQEANPLSNQHYQPPIIPPKLIQNEMTFFFFGTSEIQSSNRQNEHTKKKGEREANRRTLIFERSNTQTIFQDEVSN